MRNSCGLVAWLLAVILIHGCGDDSITDSNITPDEMMPLPGRIAFASDRDGDVEIYVMNTGGSSLVRLTESKGSDTPYSWSPDGRKLAFVSNRNGNSDIFVMAVDGSSSTEQLTEDSADDTRPLWSTDGQRIAFNSSRDGDSEIFLMDADGENLVQLTHNDVNEYVSSWSPDGEKIAFVLRPDSTSDWDDEIYLMDVDGRNAMQLTDNDTHDGTPAWSPDGQTIAFTSTGETSWIRLGANTYQSYTNTNIFLMDVDGSNVRQLTYDNISDGRLSWSPDGRYIAFRYGSKNPNLKSEIHVIDVIGGKRWMLIDWPDSNEWLPIWGPLQ